MDGGTERDAELACVMAGLTAWTVLVVQVNGLVAERLGVTQSDLQCLYALAAHGPATASELARRVNLTSGSASRMIDRLDAAGHVVRRRDTVDRRRVVVEATPASLDLVAGHYTPLTDRLRADLDGWGRDDLARLGEFLDAASASTEDVIRGL